jgi:hypothetical protein
VISATTASPSRAVRRAAGPAALAAGICTILLLVEQQVRILSATAGTTSVMGSCLSTALTTAALIPSAVMLPAAIRLAAHPGQGPLPPSAATAARMWTAIALVAVAGDLVLVLGWWSASRGPAPTASTGLRIILGIGAAVAAVSAAHATVTIGRSPARRHAFPGERPQTGRPDLIDDLATLTALALPGSWPARGVARMNRALDAWTSAAVPVRRGAPARPRIGGLLSSAVTRLMKIRPQPD